MSTRIAKVNALIQQQAAELIRTRLDMPRDVLVTVTRAETSPDLKHVTVFLSVLPQQQAPSTLRRVRTKINYLQRFINQRLTMRPVPRLRLEIDRGQQHAARIEQILAHDRG